MEPFELVGKTDYDLPGTKAQADFYRDCDQKIIDSGQPLLDIEESHTNADGSISTILTSKVPLRDDKGDIVGILGIFTDITDRKEHEEELIRQRELLRDVIENIPVRVFWKDRDMVYQGANANFAKDIGVEDPAELIGKTDNELVVPHERAQFFNYCDREVMLRGESMLDVEEQQLRPDKTVATLLTSKVPMKNRKGEVAGVLGIYQDISERKNAEDRLRLTQFALDHSSEPAYWIKANGRFTYVNQAACTMLGHTREALLAASVMDVTKGMTQAEWVAHFRMIKQAGSSTFDTTHVTRTSREIPVEITTTYVAHGDDEYLCAFARDITQRKEVERTLKRAKRNAEEANRAKSRFLANMSHEIRTPITAVMGYTDMLMKESHLTEDATNWARRLKHNAEHLLALINDSLDLSKIEAGELTVAPRPCDPMDALREIELTMSPFAENKNLAFHFDLPDQMPRRIHTDPTRLKQILINLLSNAIKFTERGHVTLHVSTTIEDNQWRIHYAVEDTGIGIPSDKLEQVFQPFTQVHETETRHFGGTGLGLDISKRLANLLQGDIRVTSQKGIGSTFTLSILGGPARSTDLQPVNMTTRSSKRKPKAQADHAGSLDHQHILVVDDNPDNLKIVQFILADSGATLVTAQNGREALDAVIAADADHQPYDIILLDMQMPVLDGFETARRLRRRGLRIPIIALTAYAMTDDQERCLAAGCDAHVAKPIDPETLYQAITNLMDGHQDKQTSGTDGWKLISTMADHPRFGPLLEEYLKNLSTVAKELKAHQSKRESEAISAITHRLRGTAPNYGYPQIGRAAGQIEDALRQDATLESIRPEVDRLLDLLRAACIGGGLSMEQLS